MIESIWIDGMDARIAELRRLVWKEASDMVEDPMDEWARHLLIYEDGAPIGIGSMLENLHHRFEFYKIGIVEELRGQKRGDFLIKVLANDAWEKGAVEITLTSNKKSRSFFMKEGFFDESEPGGSQNNDAVFMRRPM